MTTAVGKKNHKKEAAIAALITAPTIADAAKSIGISEATLWRWLQEEEFQTAYHNAKKQALSQAISQLQSATSEAVQTLRDVMKDSDSPSARNQAAKTILEFAFKGMEMEELAARIEALEKALEEEHK